MQNKDIASAPKNVFFFNNENGVFKNEVKRLICSLFNCIPSIHALYDGGGAFAFLDSPAEFGWFSDPLIKSFPAQPPMTSTGTPHKLFGRA